MAVGLGFLALAALPSIVQGISGIRQSRKAKKIKLPNRPDYQIPNALMERVGLDRTQMNSQMPGTSYYQNEIAANTAGLRSSVERNTTDANKSLLMAAVENQIANKAQNRLLGQQAKYRVLQEDQYKDSLSDLSGEQKNAWKWNVGDKYLQEFKMKYDLKNSLMRAGKQNQFAALNNLASLGVSYGMGGFGGAGAGTGTGVGTLAPPTLGNVSIFDNYQGLPGNYPD